MVDIKQISITKEAELEDLIIKKYLKNVEDGLKLLMNQVRTDSGPLDVLCVDEEGVLTIIELKIVEEDEALIQSLRYLDWVDKNRDRIKDWSISKKLTIDDSKQPRIILIAPSFSETIKRVIKYVDVDITLFEYIGVEIGTEKGLIFRSVITEESPSIVREPPSVEGWLNYFADESLKNLCNNIIKQVLSISPEIQVRAQKYYFGFYYRNRLLGQIQPKKHFFWYLTAKDLAASEVVDWRKLEDPTKYSGNIEQDAKERFEQLKSQN